MFHRRKFLGLLSGFFTIAAFRPLNAAIPTPRATEGPFYPIGHAALTDKDNDLVRIKEAVQQAGGQILNLSGTVRDETGTPLEGAKVEIWQCDVNGRYIHESDWSITRSRDEHFQGYGSTQTDENGTYHFRTIKPVPYPGRTPHIHFKIHNPKNGKILTTQMYVADEVQNNTDSIYQRLSLAEQNAVTVEMVETGPQNLKGQFNIVLNS